MPASASVNRVGHPPRGSSITASGTAPFVRAALEEADVWAREAEEVKDIGRRTIGHAAHRMGQFVERNANQQIWIDIS